jgi:hypothetical protein
MVFSFGSILASDGEAAVPPTPPGLWRVVGPDDRAPKRPKEKTMATQERTGKQTLILCDGTRYIMSFKKSAEDERWLCSSSESWWCGARGARGGRLLRRKERTVVWVAGDSRVDFGSFFEWRVHRRRAVDDFRAAWIGEMAIYAEEDRGARYSARMSRAQM